MYPKKKVKYKVTNAKTERYKNLPIISMQNLLNSDYKRNVNLVKIIGDCAQIGAQPLNILIIK